MQYYCNRVERTLYRFEETPRVGTVGEVLRYDGTWGKTDTAASEVLFDGGPRLISEEQAQKIISEGWEAASTRDKRADQ
ncbi:hypothetical protein MycrhN_2544 [Mycolicibacterium rhodesiae NBB3]|uniref:Uncharacterized protein n=1 Tax=Mycolicibacterium rhodesiae (strain NBB3) TaxID=710685 RepID=G8RX81_MYCRN|nr:hypothetical protein MycrhN_2544 [Mycolicibacterium rhodesiae NBB3]